MYNKMNFSRGGHDEFQAFYGKNDTKGPRPDQMISNTAGLNRQDSLAIASSLQEVDRNRISHGFMEENLDLDDYLQVFAELDVAPDTLDLDDQELQKAHILYDDLGMGSENDCFNPDPFSTMERFEDFAMPAQRNNIPAPIINNKVNISPFEEDDDAYRMNFEQKPVIVASPSPPAAKKSTRKVKRPAHLEEETYNDEWNESTSDSSRESPEPKPKRGRKSNGSILNYKPTTTARKYQLKPETEKTQPIYKIKRARNNDAVRKSRNKAKEEQKKKDEAFRTMKDRITQLEGELEVERKARASDKKLIDQLINEMRELKNGRK